MSTLDLIDNGTLDTVRMHARSAAWHRTMASRLPAGREASMHAVSAGIAADRLQRELTWAREAEDIDAAVLQVAVMEGEAAGVDDADAATAA